MTTVTVDTPRFQLIKGGAGGAGGAAGAGGRRRRGKNRRSRSRRRRKENTSCLPLLVCTKQRVVLRGLLEGVSNSQSGVVVNFSFVFCLMVANFRFFFAKLCQT